MQSIFKQQATCNMQQGLLHNFIKYNLLLIVCYLLPNDEGAKR